MENYADRCELDEMKQQIQLLKDKLAKEIIVSEKLIRHSTQDKVSYINRKKKFMYFFIVFALVYCNVFSSGGRWCWPGAATTAATRWWSPHCWTCR